MLLTSCLKPGRSSLIAALLIGMSLLAHAATITITANTNWSALTGGSGPGGLPNNTDIVQIQNGATLTVNVGNAAAGTLTAGGGSNNTNSILSFNSGSDLTVTTFTVGAMGMRKGSLNMASGGILHISGVCTISNLNTFTPGTGIIDYNGTAQTVNSLLTPYNDLILSGSGIKTLTSVTVNGILSMQGTATATGTPAFGAAATLEYKGSAAQTTGTEFPATFSGTGGVMVNNTAGVTLDAIRTIGAASNLTIGASVSSSVFSDGGFQLTCTGTLNLTSGIFNLGTAGVATSFPAFSTLNFGAGTTVSYNSGVAQNVAAHNYPNLTFTNAGTKTLASGTTTVTGTWSTTGGAAALNTNNASVTVTTAIAGSGNITSGTGTITLSGNWTNSGTFTAGTGTVIYNGASQTIAALTYYDLTITQSAGTASLNGNTTVNNTFSLNAGSLLLASNNLTVGASGSISVASPSASNMIIASGGGELRKGFSANGSFTFPVGDNTGTSEYSPITITVSGSGYSSAYVGVSITNAKHPNNASTTHYLNRYWSLTQSGVTGCSVNVSGTYTTADISGTETSIRAAVLSGTFNQGSNPWVRYSALAANTLTVTASPLTAGVSTAISGITGADPTVSISGGGVSVCANTPVALSTTVGGDPSFTYLWNPSTGLSSSTVSNPTATVATTTAYTVTATDGNGITASAQTTITIDPGLPAGMPGGITGNVITCNGATGVQYSIQPALNAASYSWTVPAGATIASGTGTRIITVNFPGSYTTGDICVTALNICNFASAQRCLTVKNVSAFTPASINGSSNVCTNSTGLVYSIPPVDGASTYNWTIPTGMTITAGTGTRTITVDVGPTLIAGPMCVTVSNACGTSQARCKNITVSATNVPGGISGISTACAGLTGIVWSVQPVSGASSYTWSVPAGFTIVSGQGTRIVTVDAGSSPVAGSVCVTATFACGTSQPRCKNITISGAGVGAITGLGFVCPGATGIAYSVTAVAGAVSYNWTMPAGITQASGGTTNSITVDIGVGFIQGDICVSVTTPCGTGISSCKTIQSIGQSMPGGITGPIVVCPNTTNLVYSVQPVSNAVSYNWTVPAGMTIVSGGTTRIVTVDIGPSYTTGAICVTATTSCGIPSSPRCLDVTYIPLSTPPGVNGPGAICAGSNGLVYTVSSVNGATSYSWTLPTGVTFALGSPTNTNSITVDVSASYTTGNICVASVNACGTSNNSCKTLTEFEAFTPGGMAGPEVVCPNATGLIWSVQPVSGAVSYEWIVPTGITITSGGTTNTITADIGSGFTVGDIGVRAISPCATKSLIRWFGTAVSVNPGIPGNITSSVQVCPSTTVTFSVPAVDGASTYEWTLPSGMTFTAGPPTNTNSVSVDIGAGFTQGDLCVKGVSTCTVAGYMKCQTFNIIPATPGNITGPVGVCASSTGLAYSVPPVTGAASYVWTLPQGWNLVSGSGTNSITADASAGFYQGQISVHAVSSCGNNGGNKFLNVSANPATPGVISGPAAVCNGSTVVYSVVAVSGAASYNWTLPTGLTFTPATPTNSNSISVDASAGFTGGDICVTASSTCGGTSAERCLTLGTIPVAPVAILGSAAVCTGSTGLIYSVDPVSGATSYQWTAPANMTIQSGQGTNSITVDIGPGFAGGNLCVTANAGCGPGTATCLAIGLTPAAPTVINVPANFCPGSVKTLTVDVVSGAASYNWTLPAGLTEVYGNGTSSLTVLIGPGFVSGSVCVTAATSCAATSAAYCQPIGLTPAGSPSSINSSSQVCGGSNVTLSVAVTPGAGSFMWVVPAGMSITSGQGSPSIVVSVSAGYTTGQVCVTTASGCGASGTQTCQTFSSIPALPGNITGPAAICGGQSGVVYSVPAQSGISSYNWSVPANITISSGQGSNAITVSAAGGFTSGQLGVTAVSPCGVLSAQKTLTIGTTLGAPGSINSPASTCNNTTGLAFSIPLLTGSTSYMWTVSPDITITSGQTTNAIVVSIGAVFSSGQVCVSAVSACGLPGNQRCVTVRSLPNQPGGITGPTKGVCGQTLAYSIPVATGATSYTWTAATGASIASGQGTRFVTVSFTNSFASGQLSVISVNVCGMSIPRNSSTITGAPMQPGPITGPSTVCANSTGNIYSVPSDPNATGHTWTAPGTGVITNGQGTTSVTITWGTTTGSVTVIATNACGNSPSASFNSVVNCRMSTPAFADASIQVYPNPAHESVTFEFTVSSAREYALELTDLAGRMLIRQEDKAVTGQNRTTVALDGLPQGVYLLRITGAGVDETVTRIMKE